MSQQINYPQRKFRSRSFTASIFLNEARTKNGPKQTKSVQLQKSYKDPATGDWKNFQITLFPDEIADAQLVLSEAHKYTRLKETSEQ